MAAVTITVPDVLLPNMLVRINTRLTNDGIDTTGMTNAQKARAYIVQLVKADYIDSQYQASATSAGATVQAAVTQARTDAAGIV